VCSRWLVKIKRKVSRNTPTTQPTGWVRPSPAVQEKGFAIAIEQPLARIVPRVGLGRPRSRHPASASECSCGERSRVLELGIAMGRRYDAARAAVEVDPAGHSSPAAFVYDPGLAIAGEGLRRLLVRVEAGRQRWLCGRGLVKICSIENVP